MSQSVPSNMNFQFHTFGCKVNTYDSGLIQKNVNSYLKKNAKITEAQSLSVEKSQSAIHVLNTCAVTAEATQEAIRLVRRLKAKDPMSMIVVTGCAAQVDTEHFDKIPSVDLIIANSHKGLLPSIVDEYFKRSPSERLAQRVYKSNIFQKEDLEAGGGEEKNHTRSFLKIQDGCNSFCTYCIIPFARGKSRSIPVQELTQRINQAYEQGVREVVLTGVHIGDYEDSGKGLVGLITELLKNTSMPRFRLSSLEPIELTDDLLSLYSNERMCPHFHMSIQSANTDVLRDMKRNYGQAEVVKALNSIKQYLPQAFVGMDVITGFPTETEEKFEDTYQCLSEAPWTRIHVFPYSERPGTFAARYKDQVYPHVRKERAKQLRELSLHRYQINAQEKTGHLKKVIALKDRGGFRQALSNDYWPVILPQENNHDWVLGQEYLVQFDKYLPGEFSPEGVHVASFQGAFQ